MLLGPRRRASAIVRSPAPFPGRFSGAASGEAGFQSNDRLVEAQAPTMRVAATTP
jgi:hypothetical protein